MRDPSAKTLVNFDLVKEMRAKRVKIRVKRPYIGYPGSVLQNTYGEALKHGYLLWDIKDGSSFDVAFHELPNPKPYVTLPWMGDVDSTLDGIDDYPPGTRYRIYSIQALSHLDTVSLTTTLRQEHSATEVTFKTDQHTTNNVITTGNASMVKEDLRNPDVLLGLVQEFYGPDVEVTADEWIVVKELIGEYLAQAAADNDIVRNTKWSIKRLEFDNLFNFGESNVIDVGAMDGITGIFGANRSGKSSIVGCVMYVLFNTTDRGSVRSFDLINARKPYCSARIVVNVNGTDYLIERQSTKHQDKHGRAYASTALNVFRLEDDVRVDMAGEQRTDTDKVVRGLIGSDEDALLTTISAQGEINHFIQQGQTKRQQILSRFLDLEVIHKIYEQSKGDVNFTKGSLKSVPEREWATLLADNVKRLAEIEETLHDRDTQLDKVNDDLSVLRAKLADHHDVTPVTFDLVERHRVIVQQEQEQLDAIDEQLEVDRIELERLEAKVTTIDSLETEHDIVELKRRFDAYRTLDAAVVALRHSHEKEAALLQQQQRSLKILDEVPCGDEYPSCKFIKDAHVNKLKITAQRMIVEKAIEKVDKAEQALVTLKGENLEDRLKKVEQLRDLRAKLLVAISNKRSEIDKGDSSSSGLKATLLASRSRLVELEGALKNEENAEIVLLRLQMDQRSAVIRRLDIEKLELASERGTIRADMNKLEIEQLQRDDLLRKMKAYDLLSRAFSKRGIPATIIASQLPFINSEISKILNGTVDFTIELEYDEASDSLEVYIDYGDSRRIIEMCSGMEKTIASIAIRVALINVTTLPKSDLVVLDEPLGPMDEASVEACNRLLVSLKRYFKTIILITHVEGAKEAADQVLEITKHEKDAHVFYV